MKVEKNKIKLKTSDWIFKIRKEGRRMKIYMKLTKAESGQWDAVKGAVIGKDSKMSDGEFAKIMMFRGLNGFMDDVNKAIDGMSEEEKAKVLEDAGVDPVAPEVVLEVPNLSELDESTTELKG
tara:strand:- start:453 stop:821 length:369 start_codon:yes stop_codon:yes gene_type:complete